MIKFNEPCFAEDIEAWDFGPVVPVAYHVYKRFGAGEIPYAFGGTYNGHISLKSQNAIAEVIDSLAKYSASDLVRSPSATSTLPTKARSTSNREPLPIQLRIVSIG